MDQTLSNTLRAVCAEPYGFWLDSALPYRRLGTRSFWGADPAIILRSDCGRIEIERRHGPTERLTGDPFEVLRALLDERKGKGAAVGYLGYGLKRHLERLPDRAADDLGLPECHIAFYDRVHVIDPRALAPPLPVLGLPPVLDGLRSTFTREAYEAAVRRALGYIRAGDIYQVNLSQRFEAFCQRDEFDTYLRLRAQAPAPFAAFLRYPGYVVMSCSPERFLRYDPERRLVETRPIKGTRPRGPGPRSDRALADELLASAKDRAENVMIVDLERNDLGRVAEVGSVRVTALCELESFPSVHHLTSTVVARLRADRDIVDLLRAAFPGGSVTGAPKIRAMQIIDELEPVARGVYTGAIGYIEPGGGMDLNVAIRTVVAKNGTAWFHVGGGIVADSDPAQEYEETLHKGAALARALVGEGP
ncbi:MAG TPA: aminodeoxychorismate synthase component I [Dehalococcoidia bacterium]|nr:aminodeoxychorismate synthase component I [Dehalococcoidia bacterium]